MEYILLRFYPCLPLRGLNQSKSLETMCSKQSYIRHKQVPAKVTAYVDEGIKELVELLNMIPNVCTIESCEGDNSRPACVSLDYGVDYDNNNCDIHALVEFTDKLWDTIKEAEFKGKIPAGTMEYITLSIEWHPRHYPMLWINVGKQYIKHLVNILLPLCNEHILNKRQYES